MIVLRSVVRRISCGLQEPVLAVQVLELIGMVKDLLQVYAALHHASARAIQKSSVACAWWCFELRQIHGTPSPARPPEVRKDALVIIHTGQVLRERLTSAWHLRIRSSHRAF